MKSNRSGPGQRARSGPVRRPRDATRFSRANANGGGRGHQAAKTHQQFLDLAREAVSRGDLIEAENFYQHAEHYLRQAREREG